MKHIFHIWRACFPKTHLETCNQTRCTLDHCSFPAPNSKQMHYTYLFLMFLCVLLTFVLQPTAPVVQLVLWPPVGNLEM